MSLGTTSLRRAIALAVLAGMGYSQLALVGNYSQATPPASQQLGTQPPMVLSSNFDIDRNQLRGMNLAAALKTQADSIQIIKRPNKNLMQMAWGDRNQAIVEFVKNGGAKSTQSTDSNGAVVDAAGGGFADTSQSFRGINAGPGTKAPPIPNPPNNGQIKPLISNVVDLNNPSTTTPPSSAPLPVKRLGKVKLSPISKAVANPNKKVTDAASQYHPRGGAGTGGTTPATPATPATPETPDTPATPSAPMGGGFGGWGGAVGGILSNLPAGGGSSSGDGGEYGGGYAEDDGQVVDSVPVQPVDPAAGSDEPPVQNTATQPVVAEAGSVDLVLEDVKMSDDATVVAGPAYSVRFRNQGIASSGKFLVAIVASTDGRLSQNAPKTIMKVPGLAAGEMQELTLRLPRCQFSHLIVIIDAVDSVQELDETNNSAVLDKGVL
jgi:CARDB